VCAGKITPWGLLPRFFYSKKPNEALRDDILVQQYFGAATLEMVFALLLSVGLSGATKFKYYDG
jgi:hypothetical protein